MATQYGLVCESCNGATTGSVSYSAAFLADVVRAAPHIVALERNVPDYVFRHAAMTDIADNLVPFLAQHVAHAAQSEHTVTIVDEYGNPRFLPF